MRALRVRVEVALLQALLITLGALMGLASRRVDRFRRQVTSCGRGITAGA
jgi:hypothetical protein